MLFGKTNCGHLAITISGAAAVWQFIGAILAVWLAFSGVLLGARTALGATRPLAWQQLVLATLGLLAAAWLSRAAVALSENRRDRARIARFCGVLTSSGLLLWAVSLTHGSGFGVAGVAMFLSLIAEEVWAWRKIMVCGRLAKRVAKTRSRATAHLVQQFTRSATVDGAEFIQGRLAVRIEPGSRMAAAHIAFCPPFIERPQFEAQLIEPAIGTLKVTQLYAHGARLEMRLPQMTDADVRLLVRFTGRSVVQPRTSSSVAHKLGSSR